MKTFIHILLFVIVILTNGFTRNIFGQGKSQLNKFQQFIPAAFRIMDMASADLNYDNLPDYVIVLQNINETWDGNEARPLLIILGEDKGKLTFFARNDSVVLTKNGGGVFGDPYKGLNVKKGFVSVEHSVGATWKWNRVIAFIYDSAIKEFVLNKDADISYHISNPTKQSDILYNTEVYNQLLFSHYSFNKNNNK